VKEYKEKVARRITWICALETKRHTIEL